MKQQPAKKPSKPRMTPEEQLQNFRDMAKEVGADESPGALERSFAKLDPKAKPEKLVKPKRP